MVDTHSLRLLVAALGLAGAAMAGLWHGGALAQTPVDLQLALAVDASGSVSQYRFELQKRGYVNAFRNPRLAAAVKSGLNQRIAVTMFQWTGPRLQRRVIPWMLVKDEDTSKGVADAIEKDVPVPTLTTALFTRFRSRQEESFAEKMLAALRNAFGGHAVRR